MSKIPIFPTPALDISDLAADTNHFTPGRGGFEPMFIVIHHTGGVDSRKWLSTTSRPAVSTHRLITKAGANIKIVKDEDTAYTAGFAEVGPIDPDLNDPPGIPRNFNQASLNIELENLGNGRDPYPAAQLDMCAAQIVEWWGQYGFLAVVGHGWVDARKDDPRGFPWDKLYMLMASRLRRVLCNV